MRDCAHSVAPYPEPIIGDSVETDKSPLLFSPSSWPSRVTSSSYSGARPTRRADTNRCRVRRARPQRLPAEVALVIVRIRSVARIYPHTMDLYFRGDLQYRKTDLRIDRSTASRTGESTKGAALLERRPSRSISTSWIQQGSLGCHVAGSRQVAAERRRCSRSGAGVGAHGCDRPRRHRRGELALPRCGSRTHGVTDRRAARAMLADISYDWQSVH